MGSTRLPGKSLLELSGKPVIQHVIERVKATSSIDKLVVATTNTHQDDRLASFVKQLGIPVFRGQKDDVLRRFAGAARRFGGNTIVRITGDDPLKDPSVIDLVVRRFLSTKEEFDCVSNTITPTFPEGQDTEVLKSEALYKVDTLAKTAYDREHVTPYIYSHPESFRCLNVTNDFDLSHYRWTLDTKQDLAFFTAVFQELQKPGEIVSMSKILDLLERKPEIAQLNSMEGRSDRYKKA